MRARQLWALLLGVVALGGLTALPSAARAPSHARSTAHRPPSVSATLLRLRRSGAVSEAAYRGYCAAYVAAKRSVGRLQGTRQVELGAVLANLQAIAAAGGLTASRLPALFLTLERNREWWTTQPLPSSGQRVSFPHSRLVWEYYAGQGLEIQWLGTFGEANGYFLSGHENANLRQLLGEVIPLAARRGGGIAWEYLFQFDGGQPPWSSGLSQGTAIQVLSRAYTRFHEPADLAAAQQALGIFRTPPPTGIRVATSAGAHYLEYTFAPRDRILNGFIQSLIGLYDYTQATGDPLGLSLFDAGDREARAEVPRYDTGAWSLYDQFGESNLNYHELLTEFLRHLCERTSKGPPAPAPVTPTPTPTPTTPTSGGTGGTSSAGIALAHVAGAPIAADAIYCTTAKRFGTDLSTPPVVALLTTSLRGGGGAAVRFSLSKISSVSITIRQGSRVVFSDGGSFEHGAPSFSWSTPAGGGSFAVTLSATDLAGNFATAYGTILVSHH